MKIDITVAVVSVSPDDDNFAQTSRNSVILGGQSPQACSQDEALKVVANTQYAHVLLGGTVVLPGFYEAMMNTCEHAKADYACCPCARLGGKDPAISVPGDGEIVCGQILVRSWVLRELGLTEDIKKIFSRVIKEYCGESVPHVLCMEL